MLARKLTTGLLLLAISCTLSISGCATTKLWSSSTYERYVLITPKHKDDDVEAALEASGKNYYCKIRISRKHADKKSCYMSETEARSLSEKIIATPEAVLLDILMPIVTTVAIVGYLVLDSKMTNAINNERQKNIENSGSFTN